MEIPNIGTGFVVYWDFFLRKLEINLRVVDISPISIIFKIALKPSILWIILHDLHVSFALPVTTLSLLIIRPSTLLLRDIPKSADNTPLLPVLSCSIFGRGLFLRKQEINLKGIVQYLSGAADLNIDF